MKVGFAFPLRQLHWWLGLAIVVLAVIVVVLRALEKRRQGRLTRFVQAELAPRLLAGYDASIRRPLFWLTVLGFASLALTFAQPHWGQAWQKVSQQSHDIIVCLDTSESMRAANPLPSRLERAKQKILSLLERAPGDRFALVAFSGGAALQCPLTHDHGYFKAVLKAVDTDTISLEGTDIAEAIEEAVKVFRDESEESGIIEKDTRAILLISDGEQVSGDAVSQAEDASDFARVYVIGVGDPHGAEIKRPELMGRRGGGQGVAATHHSRLDEETLSKVAIAGDGGYVRSMPDNSDIGQIRDHIEQLAAYSASSELRLRLVNRYQWPLALAVFLFAAEGLWLVIMPYVRAWRLRKRRSSTAETAAFTTEGL